MSNDRELLELAALAADIEFDPDNDHLVEWNPLESDAQAFRLAVKLDISTYQLFAMVQADYPCIDEEFNARKTICEGVLDDYYAATRRVIVRAAAAMAKTTA